MSEPFDGWRRIRTFESVANRFTVCPLWPLGNPSKYGTYRARTYDPLLVRQMLYQFNPVFLLSTLVRCRYRHRPRTRYYLVG